MLKDTKGKWAEILEVTEELWEKMMREIALNRIPKLLDCAEKLLRSNGNEPICAGLYTYAIEEYGKLLFLKQCGISMGKVEIKYRNEFRNHDAKFGIAIKSLPKECTTLHKGIFDPKIFQKRVFDVDEVADLEARLTIFYSDFADSADSIKSIPSVDKDCLQRAINQLKTIVLGTTIP